MKHIIPDYYNNFKCISDKCKHNCCIGWEIDIDDQTYNKYVNIKSKFGSKLKSNIKSENGRNYFMLTNNDRCPFLNENNLCDIIINCGENHLCEICSEHPRFHNYYEDRIESGIGLCCEEAARIILTNKDTVKLECSDISTESGYYYQYRDKLFKIVQNRDLNIKERINRLIEQCDYKTEKIHTNEWIKLYLSLERLDNSWTDILKKCETTKNNIFEIEIEEKYETLAEQLIIYFLYRYTPKAEYEMSVDEWIIFAILSCMIIFCLCKYNNMNDIEGLIEISRMYSQEVEYSDENIDILFSSI
jgi:lysine-N-methylase